MATQFLTLYLKGPFQTSGPEIPFELLPNPYEQVLFNDKINGQNMPLIESIRGMNNKHLSTSTDIWYPQNCSKRIISSLGNR